MTDIFEYIDYRKFLAVAWAERKAADPRFSHRFIGLRAGFASSGFFARLLSGSVNLTPSGALRLAEIFRLGMRETRYFELLVLYSHSRSQEEKALFLDRIVSSRKTAVARLEPDQIAFLRDWRAVAVLQALDIVEHIDRHVELGRMLHPQIPGREVSRILELLDRLDLAHRDDRGIWRKTESVLSSGDSDDGALRTFQKDAMSLAMKAIDRFPRSERSISTLTLSLSGPTFERLRDRLRILRREALELAHADERPDRVVQINFQMFPLATAPKAESE
jgi:uncharacterized protein (TIGR02147 family)